MKTTKLIIYITLILTLTNCKNETKVEIKTKPEQTKIIDSTLNVKAINKQAKINIPKNVDSEFEIFIKIFNTDSIFQISRVKFPLNSTEINYDNYETIEKTINLDNYEIIDLTIDPTSETKEYDKYTQKTILTESKAIIEFRGIDNGINCEYEFEKIEGKWNLTSWKNLST
ncbi:hypothetical protein GCM10022291_32720 [Postechiella marina]|uniref:DUF4348 domain-containing protein n=1 Tax=Postechiella marina TaxID=943941 RepID=A0ABP8CHJ9_9FLAO